MCWCWRKVPLGIRPCKWCSSFALVALLVVGCPFYRRLVWANVEVLPLIADLPQMPSFPTFCASILKVSTFCPCVILLAAALTDYFATTAATISACLAPSFLGKKHLELLVEARPSLGHRGAVMPVEESCSRLHSQEVPCFGPLSSLPAVPGWRRCPYLRAISSRRRCCRLETHLKCWGLNPSRAILGRYKK